MMIHADLKIEDGRVLVWKITESIDELLSAIQHPDTIADFQKIKTEKRKFEFLAARVALKKILGKEYSVFYTEAGKPFLSENCCNISISHSGKWIAVAAHPFMQIGVDIECLSDKIQKLYKRFLSEEEQSDLLQGTNLKQLQIAWSAKEAMYKIIGKEAVDFAKQLRIYPFETEEINGELTAEHTVSGKLYNLHYFQNTDYTLVYCIN